MKERKVLKEESIKSGDIGLEKESKRLGKVIKKSLMVDKKSTMKTSLEKMLILQQPGELLMKLWGTIRT